MKMLFLAFCCLSFGNNLVNAKNICPDPKTFSYVLKNFLWQEIPSIASSQTEKGIGAKINGYIVPEVQLRHIEQKNSNEVNCIYFLERESNILFGIKFLTKTEDKNVKIIKQEVNPKKPF